MLGELEDLLRKAGLEPEREAPLLTVLLRAPQCEN